MTRLYLGKIQDSYGNWYEAVTTNKNTSNNMKEVKEIEAAKLYEDETGECKEAVYKYNDQYYSTFADMEKICEPYDILTAEEYQNEYHILNKVLTFAEASEKFDVAVSTLRHRQRDGRFEDGDTRKSGSTWLVTYEAMQRLYGEQKNG